jgi:hypothetical protein
VIIAVISISLLPLVQIELRKEAVGFVVVREKITILNGMLASLSGHGDLRIRRIYINNRVYARAEGVWPCAWTVVNTNLVVVSVKNESGFPPAKIEILNCLGLKADVKIGNPDALSTAVFASSNPYICLTNGVIEAAER